MMASTYYGESKGRGAGERLAQPATPSPLLQPLQAGGEGGLEEGCAEPLPSSVELKTSALTVADDG